MRLLLSSAEFIRISSSTQSDQSLLQGPFSIAREVVIGERHLSGRGNDDPQILH